ncbi:predicted protein [Chaetoceros tenuissimus]|uniref:Uncharacterized protein n=1 Tax=Chaetoceros tenuissimus TaxID=426638 RepID=A0AAD3CWC9_9STRA|nr:predicted protein [Chaetoceros tenuissimus]
MLSQSIVDQMFIEGRLFFVRPDIVARSSFNGELWETVVMPYLWNYVINHCQAKTGRFMIYAPDPKHPPTRMTEPLTVGKLIALVPCTKPMLSVLVPLCRDIKVFLMVNGVAFRHNDRGIGVQSPDFRGMGTFGDFPKYLGFGLKEESNWTYFRQESMTFTFMDKKASGRIPLQDGNDERLQHHAICPDYNPTVALKEVQKASLTFGIDFYLKRGDVDPDTKEKDDDYSSLELKHVREIMMAEGVIEELDHKEMETTVFNKKNEKIV